MGSRAGGVFDFFGAGDSTYRGQIKNAESLIHIRDPRVYKETTRAISRFYAAMGIPERNIKIADLSKGVFGAGAKGGVYLNKAYYNKPYKDFVKVHANQEAIGWFTKTNKASMHTTTHELAHALWSSSDKAPKAIAAGKEIKAAYKAFRNAGKGRAYSRGYGKYAFQNVDEWWAETVTKAVHGKTDKYTQAVKSIAKKYKL